MTLAIVIIATAVILIYLFVTEDSKEWKKMAEDVKREEAKARLKEDDRLVANIKRALKEWENESRKH